MKRTRTRSAGSFRRPQTALSFGTMEERPVLVPSSICFACLLMTGKRTSSAASNCSTTIKMRAQRQSERASAAAGVTKYASRQRRPARSGKKIASHIQLIVGAVVFRDASRRHLQSSLDRRNTSRNPYRRIPVAEWLGPSFQSTNCNPSTDDGVESILECPSLSRSSRSAPTAAKSPPRPRSRPLAALRSHTIVDTKGCAAPAGKPKANNCQPSRFCTAVALKRPQVPQAPGEDKPQSRPGVQVDGPQRISSSLEALP
jgi:hypothetical protein